MDNTLGALIVLPLLSRKVVQVSLATIFWWVGYGSFVLRGPVTLNGSAGGEATVSGELRVLPAYTRGQGAWHRLFVGDIEVVCSPAGYNHCNVMGTIAPHSGKNVTATYIVYRENPLHTAKLLTELRYQAIAILSKPEQMVRIGAFNERLEVINPRFFAYGMAPYLLLVGIVLMWKRRQPHP